MRVDLAAGGLLIGIRNAHEEVDGWIAGAVGSAAVHGESAVVEEVEGIVDDELLDMHTGFDVVVAAHQGEVVVRGVVLVIARLRAIFAEAEGEEIAETDSGQANGFSVLGINGEAIGRRGHVAWAWSRFDGGEDEAVVAEAEF